MATRRIRAGAEDFSITYCGYSNKLRPKLIGKRMAGNQMPIKQIAHEFGFTDESHLSNYFKKRKNIKPSDFKKLYQRACSGWFLYELKKDRAWLFELFSCNSNGSE